MVFDELILCQCICGGNHHFLFWYSFGYFGSEVLLIVFESLHFLLFTASARAVISALVVLLVPPRLLRPRCCQCHSYGHLHWITRLASTSAAFRVADFPTTVGGGRVGVGAGVTVPLPCLGLLGVQAPLPWVEGPGFWAPVWLRGTRVICSTAADAGFFTCLGADVARRQKFHVPTLWLLPSFLGVLALSWPGAPGLWVLPPLTEFQALQPLLLGWVPGSQALPRFLESLVLDTTTVPGTSGHGCCHCCQGHQGLGCSPCCWEGWGHRHCHFYWGRGRRLGHEHHHSSQSLQLRASPWFLGPPFVGTAVVPRASGPVCCLSSQCLCLWLLQRFLEPLISGDAEGPGASSLRSHCHCFPGSVTSMRTSPLTFRCTDVWIPQAFWYAVQRILC